MAEQIVGVVVPAFHGRGDLRRSLESLADQDLSAPLHVVVAVNDRRADSVREADRLADPVRERPRTTVDVLRTAPGRPAAFTEAERLLPAGVRVHLDQDAVLSPGALRRLAWLLRPGSGVNFAVPEPTIARRRSRWTRGCYAAWCRLPYVQEGQASMGVYAVSAEGRRRWTTLPADVGSDDKWVRLHFAPRERAVVRGETYEVVAPEGLRELVAARRRYLRANRHLDREFPELRGADLPRCRGALRCLFGRPSRWISAAGFVLVYAAAGALELFDGRVRRVHTS